MVTCLQALYSWNGSYCMSSAFIKLSLLFQYLRIFDKGSHRVFCIVVLAITAGWGFSYSFIAWFSCFPPLNFVSGYCYGFASSDAHTLYGTFLSHSATNMALDLVILLTPLPLLFRKNTQRNTKMGLIALFSMGGV
jgi:hypothetical protein